MIKRSVINRVIAFLALAVFAVASLFCLSGQGAVKVLAAENTVRFDESEYHAQDSGLVYVNLIVQGVPGQTVGVTYRTQGETAIQGVDYGAVSNTVSIKISSGGEATYRIAIKTLNSADTREKLRTYSKSGEEYGRYFTLEIVKAENAVITEGRGKCKCYLSYNSKTEISTGIKQGNTEVAYINDYQIMQSIYNKGKGNLDGKKTWKTWKNGVSFANSTTTRWLNTFISTGMASAYTSFMIRTIDNSEVYSGTDIHVLAGNDEFYRAYDGAETGIPGTYLYITIDPHYWEWADKINGRVMYLISQKKNPYDEDSNYIDVSFKTVSENSKRVYWLQDKDAWFANKDALTDSVFWKIDPYNGVLDSYLAIYNRNREVDIKFKDLWFFLTLIDDKCPVVTEQYLDDSMLESTGKLRFYVRYNEPVYSFKQKPLEVKFNNGTTPYPAYYVGGNYSDTLVYEMDMPNIAVKSAVYELPSDDIGDLAYNLDAYNKVQNNKVQNTDQKRVLTIINGDINFIKPRLAIDKESSSAPKNNYNLVLSLNDNGDLDLNEGEIYYEWSKEEKKTSAEDITAYSEYRRVLEEDMGSINVSLSANTAGAGSGAYYLHALAKGKYGTSATATFGPYVLDVDEPALVNNALPRNELKTKTFDFTNLKVGGAEIYSINMIARWKNDGVYESATCSLMDGEYTNPLLRRVSDNDYQYLSNIDPELDDDHDGNPDVPLDEFILSVMGEKSRLGIEIYFEAQDKAGNRGTSNAIAVTYDKRDTFKVSASFPAEYGYSPITDINSAYPAYDISEVDRNGGITITVSESDRSQIVTGKTALRVLIDGGEKVYETSDTDEYTVTIKDLDAGFYELIPNIIGNVDGSEIDLIATPVSFYLTDGKADKTANGEKVKGNLVLINKVYEILDAKFYYLDREDKVSSHLYGAVYDSEVSVYRGGSSYPAFSSVTEAKKYVRFMEYQDLHAVKITATMANMLNSSTGSTTFVKAAGETRTAQEGQVWIRYKKNIWTTSSNAYGWAYYFYKDGGSAEDGIDLTRISQNLTDSITAVVNKIVSAGETVYLVEESQLSLKAGSPYLAVSQTHVAEETASSGKTGIKFVSAPVYEGDSGLYASTVLIDDKKYPLATNMPITVSTATELYYHYYASDVWYPLTANDGQTLSDLLYDNASGIYTIREYSEQGVAEFDVYYDKTTPVLQLKINDETYNLDGTAINFSGNSASIERVIGEVDEYGYVALYSYPSKRLLNVFYGKDLSGYDLDLANYYLQVGDRSGNIVTYTLLLSNTALGVNVTESQSQSGIIINVLNRDESEIYSYEVYLNEELISSEFAVRRAYKDPGVYRITVVDIYGNAVTETYEYEFPSPRMTWYYANANGGYSRYDPEKIVNMIISDDPSSPRISNVYSSSRVRLIFDMTYGESPIKFEMLDVAEGDYTYSEQTGVLTVNTDDSWRLRVWFEDYPANDHTYVCRLDTESPNFVATFVGTSYSSNVSIDKDEFLKNYEEGDVISLEELEIAEGASESLSLLSGDVICGNHIAVAMFDQAGIRSYTVTRNGQEIALELDSENQLILNNYGRYVITAVDMLGNRSEFTFINLKEPIATAALDGETISEETLSYGKDDLTVTTSYASVTTVTVKSEAKSETFVFDYDGRMLSYGQYVCTTDDEIGTDSKYAEYVQIASLDLLGESIRAGRWYSLISGEDYTLSILYDAQNGLNYKFACIEKEIEVQALVYVGNNKRPSLFKARLSKELPTVELFTNGENVEIVDDLEYVYIAGTLTIGTLSANVTELTVAYSLTPQFTERTTIYADGEYFVTDFVGEKDGYYELVVTNIFKNQTIYIVNKIQAFTSVVTVTYLDGMTRRYDGNNGVIKSNAAIEVSVLSKDVRFDVNGDLYDGLTVGPMTVLQLNRSGEYEVKVIAANGVFETFRLEISTDSGFVYDDGWITGYNENALLKDQGYTNSRLSVDLAENVEYVDIVYDGTTTVIYDTVSETPVTDVDLNNVIGKAGNGEYTVNFRNSYGDLASKTIRYSVVPSLSISRKTVSRQGEWEKIAFGETLTACYSNYALRFATESTNYEFLINGDDVSLEEPRIIEFNNTSGNGSFEYEMFFLDEYGNVMRFKAILLRADVQIDTSAMREIVVNGRTYTKDNVSVSFDGALRATVSIDGEAATSYESGTTLYKDGSYLFTVEDVAGNLLEYSVTHKSVINYTLTDASTQQPIVMGGVINNSAVVFEARDDSQVVSMIRDGKVVDSENNKTFSTTGHWELLIKDSVGNAQYADFYLINNSLGEFSYTAPYDYEITEVWFTDERGNKTQSDTDGKTVKLDKNGDYAIAVTGIGENSSFRFTVSIDNTPPSATLVGVENNGVTAQNVTLKGLKNGDNVKIYKNGVLLEDIDVAVATRLPEITTGGDYRIVVTNVQGVTAEYNFTRKKIANTATSIFLIIVIVMVAGGISIGLLFHTRQKTDA